ncbi:relaxin receptor 1 isoform X4 [Prionailurus iriomotensis]
MILHGSGQDVKCSLGYFPCGNITKCLPQLLHCNGVDDCGNQADEDNCGDNNGWPIQFDKYFASYYKMTSLYHFETQTSECPKPNYSIVEKLKLFENEKVVGSVPVPCLCRGLEVDCDETNLRAVPSVSSNVTKMSLQRNLIRKLPPDGFKKYHHLQKLCACKTIILDPYPSMLSEDYTVLLNLYLSHNRITFLKPGVFEDLHRLEWLIIEDNHLSRISPLTFYGLNSLILLALMNNVLTHLPDKPLCQHMPRLHWLVMRKNKINHLSENTFAPLQKLDELDLGSNKIENLPPQVFKDLKELSQLNLSYNPIQKIQANQFDYLVKLKSLYFKKFQYCGYAPHVRSCKPNTDGISSLENLLASIIQRVFVWVVSAVTCFGNVFVICMRPYIRSENRLHAMSIISLCCADCLMGIYLFVIGAFDLKFRGEYNKHAQLWMESIHCQCLRPKKCRTITVLILIWMTGFIVAFIPLTNKEFFKNYYGTNGVCFPLHSEDTESTGAQIYSVAIFLVYHNLLGSDFYSAYQQCFEPNSVYSDHKTIQGNDSSVLV